MILCIVKNNYVIDRIVIEPENLETYNYPLPHDFVIEDVDLTIFIGDWYEESEDIFYRPIGKIPPDSPFYEDPTEED